MLDRRTFRFGTLLRVRRRQLDLRAADLAAVRRGIRQNQDQRDALQAEQRRILEQAGSETMRHFDAGDVRRYYQFERHLARLADEKDAAIAELRKQEEERRLELEEAHKRVRVVERLEERHEERLRAHVNKFEQHVSDEIAVNQAAMRKHDRRSP